MELFLAYLDQFRYMAGNLTIMVMLCHRSLSHRPDYRRRVLLGGLVCMALAFAYVPLQSVLRPVFVRTPIVIGPYWLLMSFVPVGFVLFCYETGFAGALFRVMMGAFTENIATVLIRNLFVYALFPDFPERRPVLYVLFMSVFYDLFYRAASITLGKRIRSDEMARLTDDRAAALLFLFTYLAYTAIMSTSKYVSEVLIVPLQAGAGFTGIYRFLQLFLVGVMLLLSVMMTAMMWYIYDRMALKAEKEVIARLAQERKAQYEFSRENIEMINRKTHDLKHQLQALALVTDEERKHQIEEASRAVDFYDAIVKTGNEALDVLLTEKIVYCTNRGIRLSCLVTTKQLNKIRLVDLYTLLGNAIDNAIESAERISDPEKKVISLSILDHGDMLYIQLENYIEGILELQDGLPKTRKANKQDHGFGLKSIRSIVHSYGGQISIRTEGQVFYLEIIIP